MSAETARARRHRRRSERPSVGRTTARGIGVILVCVLLGAFAVRVYSGLPGRDYGTLYVSTPTVGNLLSHDSVRISGARVGQVLGRKIGEDGRPLLTLQLDPGVKVPVDTTVGIRASGLLGARYVQLIPGHSKQFAPDGATIRGDDASYTYGLPEALDIFDAPTRRGLQQAVVNLGQGLFGNGRPLNRAVATLPAAVHHFDSISQAIVDRRGAAARLLPALDQAVTPLARNDPQWLAMDREVQRALAPFVRERTSVRDTLAAAPATSASIANGLGRGQRLLNSLHRLSDEANRVLPAAPSGLRELSGLLGVGPDALRRAGLLLSSAEPAVPGVLRITRALRPILPDIEQFVVHGRPSLDEVARRKCDIADFGAVMRSMTGFTQPGSGPAGPYMAFRLQIAAPLTTDVVGIKDPAGLLQRDEYSPPCRYPSTPYPQFVSTPGARR
jgi:virulence factor Mce-like protein